MLWITEVEEVYYFLSHVMVALATAMVTLFLSKPNKFVSKLSKQTVGSHFVPVQISEKTRKSGPMAYLVGAGPGDPELLTIAALRVLKQADLVITDRLVPQGVLALCTGKVVYSQKFKGCANIAQMQLEDWLIDGLNQGLVVVRLKGGDPFLYGRGMEEVARIVQAGFSVKVISGISSSLAAPLAAGISITARHVANKVLIATAHGKYDTYPDIPVFDPAQTTVYLMSVSRLSNLAKALIINNYPEETPVAVVERATTPAQRTTNGNLNTIGELASKRQISSPAVIVIGPAAGSHVNNRLTFDTAYRNGGVTFSPSIHSL